MLSLKLTMFCVRLFWDRSIGGRSRPLIATHKAQACPANADVDCNPSTDNPHPDGVYGDVNPTTGTETGNPHNSAGCHGNPHGEMGTDTCPGSKWHKESGKFSRLRLLAYTRPSYFFLSLVPCLWSMLSILTQLSGIVIVKLPVLVFIVSVPGTFRL